MVLGVQPDQNNIFGQVPVNIAMVSTISCKIGPGSLDLRLKAPAERQNLAPFHVYALIR